MKLVRPVWVSCRDCQFTYRTSLPTGQRGCAGGGVRPATVEEIAFAEDDERQFEEEAAS